MSKADQFILDNNDIFPDLKLTLIHNTKSSVYEILGHGYGVVLLYRGHW